MPRSKAITIWIGIGFLVATGVYPPSMHWNRSYEWIFVRPRGPAQLDIIRLLVEWAIIAAVTAGFYFAPPKLRNRKSMIGWKRVWVRQLSTTAQADDEFFGKNANWWAEFKHDGEEDTFFKAQSREQAMKFFEDNPGSDG